MSHGVALATWPETIDKFGKASAKKTSDVDQFRHG